MFAQSELLGRLVGGGRARGGIRAPATPPLHLRCRTANLYCHATLSRGATSPKENRKKKSRGLRRVARYWMAFHLNIVEAARIGHPPELCCVAGVPYGLPAVVPGTCGQDLLEGYNMAGGGVRLTGMLIAYYCLCL